MCCHECGNQLAAEYFHVDGVAACHACKEKLVAQATPLREWAPTARGLLFGIAAAVAGGALYYGVIAVTNFEIALVAIVIGYMVGWSIRRGAGGRGGRRLQVAAMAFTYLAVALSYVPLAVESAAETELAGDGYAALAGAQSGADYVLVTADGVVTQQGASEDEAPGGARTFVILLGVVLALPVMMIFGSLPSGMIGAVIIAIAMYQAWRMTAAVDLIVTGPVGKQVPEDAVV